MLNKRDPLIHHLHHPRCKHHHQKKKKKKKKGRREEGKILSGRNAQVSQNGQKVEAPYEPG
jgi:hypothetical protein